jgi:hypothetical protein
LVVALGLMVTLLFGIALNWLLLAEAELDASGFTVCDVELLVLFCVELLPLLVLPELLPDLSLSRPFALPLPGLFGLRSTAPCVPDAPRSPDALPDVPLPLIPLPVVPVELVAEPVVPVAEPVVCVDCVADVVWFVVALGLIVTLLFGIALNWLLFAVAELEPVGLVVCELVLPVVFWVELLPLVVLPPVVCANGDALIASSAPVLRIVARVFFFNMVIPPLQTDK